MGHINCSNAITNKGRDAVHHYNQIERTIQANPDKYGPRSEDLTKARLQQSALMGITIGEVAEAMDRLGCSPAHREERMQGLVDTFKGVLDIDNRKYWDDREAELFKGGIPTEGTHERQVWELQINQIRDARDKK